MTRKDFRLLARVMAHTKPSREACLATWNSVCEALATELCGTNPNFDRARFLKACTYGE